MMLTVNVHEAKTHFSRLLEQAHAGQEIILAKAGKPGAVNLAVLWVEYVTRSSSPCLRKNLPPGRRVHEIAARYPQLPVVGH